MMIKSILKYILPLLCCSTLIGCEPSSSHEKIGIVVPLEHTAMNEIVAGFTDTLKKIYPHPVQIKIANAQGDPNIQRAIIQQMRDQNDTLIVPIGTSTTQMTLAIAKTQPIVSLAAIISDKDRHQQQPCHVAIVHDEIAPQQLIAFIHQVYPHIKNISLVHSTSDKVLTQVNQTIIAGKQMGITVHHFMVVSLPDLYSTAQALPANTEAIFVLKDIPIASGISTLVNAAKKRHIPLITSDQGTVQDGASLALGVHEREIGIEGAKLAAALLQGKTACQLPVVEMKKLTVFINPTSLEQTSQKESAITDTAKHLGYTIERVNSMTEK